MQEYNRVDQKIHWLSQAIAKVNKSYVPEKSDDSHTNLVFDALGEKICGRWFDTAKGQLLLCLNLKTPEFRFMDRKQNVVASFSVFNKSMHQIEKDLAHFLVHIGMDISPLTSPLHFEIPDYGIASIEEHEISKEGLDLWKFYRKMAQNSCQNFLGYLQQESEIRIWPHHFDTGIYVQISEELGLGFGLAMKDDMVGDAYFYLSAYVSEGVIKNSTLHELKVGYWETGGAFQGAVLPLHSITSDSIVQAERAIDLFIKEAVMQLINHRD